MLVIFENNGKWRISGVPSGETSLKSAPKREPHSPDSDGRIGVKGMVPSDIDVARGDDDSDLSSS